MLCSNMLYLEAAVAMNTVANPGEHKWNEWQYWQVAEATGNNPEEEKVLCH